MVSELPSISKKVYSLLRCEVPLYWQFFYFLWLWASEWSTCVGPWVSPIFLGMVSIQIFIYFILIWFQVLFHSILLFSIEAIHYVHNYRSFDLNFFVKCFMEIKFRKKLPVHVPWCGIWHVILGDKGSHCPAFGGDLVPRLGIPYGDKVIS